MREFRDASLSEHYYLFANCLHITYPSMLFCVNIIIILCILSYTHCSKIFVLLNTDKM